MNELTKEEVLHVANLARINVSEEEVEKYLGIPTLATVPGRVVVRKKKNANTKKGRVK